VRGLGALQKKAHDVLINSKETPMGFLLSDIFELAVLDRLLTAGGLNGDNRHRPQGLIPSP
jgi:hypothetical protein